jgi:hypothetical protein
LILPSVAAIRSYDMARNLPVEPNSVCAEADEVEVESEAKGDDKDDDKGEHRMVRRFYEILFA